ncbi:MAG: outer membrane protein assembly factor BamC [Betaproteobacteria bacterium]|nr:outer membrane protein assembly factor BamC [Betaproteobacteria bacterium]
MNRLRIVLVASVALSLGACSGSLLESKKVDYKSAGKLPSLEIPPDLTAPSRDERYSVPDVSPKGTATYSVYSAERSGQTRTTGTSEVLPDVDKMRIERAGSQRWLVAAEPPEKLWPVVKEFWQELGFIVNLESPDSGIMETDWAENRAKIPLDPIRSALGKIVDQLYSTPERDKFRTRLERGATPGTTEIYVSHRSMIEVFTSEAKDTTVWQPRAADPELEAEMLRRLMVRLGAEESRARTILAAEPQGLRARQTKAADGSSTLELQESFDRAWRRVGLALDRVGFTVEDRDRAQGMYYVRYVDPNLDGRKSEPGLLSRLMFWRSDDKAAAADSRIQYRIHVRSAANASMVSVLTREGGADTSGAASRILGLLYDQLK